MSCADAYRGTNPKISDSNEAAFTVNCFGQGRAYYLATLPETKALASLLRQLCLERDITPPLGGTVAGVEITARPLAKHCFTFSTTTIFRRRSLCQTENSPI